MKKTFIFTLLLLAGLFTLASCTESFPKGKDVRFTATSSNNTATRVSYSGDVQNGRERIDWTESDVIRIYSSSSEVVNGYGYRYADYSLTDISTSDEKSTAKLQNLDPSVRGLFWEDDDAAAAATFYGITPATTPKNENNPLGGVFDNLVASGAPDLTWTTDATKHITVGAPDMSKAHLIAKPATLSSNKVNLDFYPVYTTFDITLKSKVETVQINSFEIISSSCNLSGTYSFDSSYLADGQTATDGFIQSATEVADSQKRIIVTFIDGTTISPDDSVRFTVFALPQDLTNISVKVNFGEGTPMERTLALKRNDAPITFPAFHKANITGLALDAGEWNFTVETALNVMPWTVSTTDGSPYTIDISNTVLTSQFVFNNMEYANQFVVHDPSAWTNTFQVRDDAALYITFKIDAPLGANWNVAAADPSDYFVVNKMVGGLALDPTGTVDGNTIVLRIKPNMLTIPENRTQDYRMYLHTYVTVGDNAYNIDSETQNYDYYHHLAEFIIPANN